MRKKETSSRSHRRLFEEGGAYLVALPALLVLTMLGMSLAFVTQTEMLVASHEKVAQRVFYSAESGLAVALTRLLVSNDKRAISILLDDAPTESEFHGVPVKSRIEIAPVYPVFAPYCHGCGVSQTGSYDGVMLKVNHAVSVRADLVAGANKASEKSAATKSLAAMFDIQPWNTDLPPVGESRR